MLKFTPNAMPTNVFVIGCGGTGSRVVPLIAQTMASQQWLIGARLTLVDADVVETKNTQRQNFIAPDVGRPKAQVLAERYSNAFGIEIVPIIDMVRQGTNLMRMASQARNTEGSRDAIFILCVDSAKARREILGALFDEGEASANSIVIDAGNEDIFGQISYYNLTTCLGVHSRMDQAKVKEIEDRVPFDIDLQYIPMPIAEYDYMEDGEGTGSCADLDQTLAINNLMAANIVGIFQNILYSIPMCYRRINISLNGGISTDWLDNFWLKSILSKEDNGVYQRISNKRGAEDCDAFNRYMLQGARSNSNGQFLIDAAYATLTAQELEARAEQAA